MSILTVTTINTIDQSTNLTVATGNTNASKIVIRADGSGLVIQGNSTTNTVTVNSTAVNIKGTLLANGSSGTAGQVLTSNGGGNVYWSTITGGGGGSGSVTSIGGDGTVSGLTLTGTVTSTGNLTLGGTISLPVSGISTTGTANNTTFLRGDGAWQSPGVISVASGNGLSGGPITSSGTLSINANTGIIANSTGLFVDASNITANNTNFVGLTAASDIVNTSILSASLSYYTTTNGLDSVITLYDYINRTANYTITGVHNHTANLSVNAAIILGGEPGTAGQVLTSNGVNNVYWSSVVGFITGNSGIVSNTNGIFVNANNGIVANSTGVFAKAGTGAVVNSTGIHVNSAYIQSFAVNDVQYFDGQLSSYYRDATNINAGTLANARLGAEIVNTSSAFTLTGIHTHNANLNLNANLNMIGFISLDSSFGTAGQVLTSNGTDGNPYWSSVATYAFSNGLNSSTGTVSINANTGLISNATGIYVNGNTGLVTNSTGIFVNANTGLVGNTTGIHVNTNTALITNATGIHVNGNTGLVTNSTGIHVNGNTGIVANSTGVFVNTTFITSTIGATSANNTTYLNTQPASYYTNATNITTGSLPYAQLGANVVNTSAAFTITNVHTHNANLAVSGYLTVTGVANVVGNAQISSIGVGTPASGGAGEIRATNNITAYYSSDQNFKENVVVISNALEKTNKIRGVEFDWTADYITRNGGEDNYFIRKHDVGVIAQEIEKVLPEVVATRDDGSKAVKYDRIVALLIEAIKELEARVAVLEAKQ